MNPRRTDEELMEKVFTENFEKAIEKWLDKKFAQFGRWTLGGIAASVLAVTLFVYAHLQGWFK